MSGPAAMRIESDAINDFARVVGPTAAGILHRGVGDPPAPSRMNLDAQRTKNGLGQLVLTLVKLLHELLEREAIRRIDGGDLSEEQVEQLGLTLMKQALEIERLRQEFGLEEEDLDLDLGPLGRLF